ncbi:MAG: DUF1080 domain-containing protein [Verrucomicrobia bacterium]|nr:DUF1080 domain-containing protein [Verrucomicrobiota bacterium]
MKTNRTFAAFLTSLGTVAGFSWALLALAGCAGPQGNRQSDATSQPRAGQAVVTGVRGQAEVATPPAKSETAPERKPAPERPAPEQPVPDAAWKSIFDGHTLKGWQITDFAGHGEVKVEDGRIVLEMGVALTGIKWTNEVPKGNYEVSLEASKLSGSDFFCGLTFPVGSASCTFVVGGWGGGVVGISSIDGSDASMNETTRYLEFAKDRWYRIRARVTAEKIECWIDNEKVVDLVHKDRKISMRPGEIELSEPFGIATWQTTGALRNLRIRKL